jgi:hypothetical protein
MMSKQGAEPFIKEATFSAHRCILLFSYVFADFAAGICRHLAVVCETLGVASVGFPWPFANG